MRFEIDLIDTEAVSMLNRLIAITGIEPWRKKFKTLQQQLNENGFLRDWQAERHGMELKFHELLVQQDRIGSFPVQLQDHRHYNLYGFAASVVRIHEKLSSAGKMRLRGMLIDGLKPDNNLLALQHEVATAVHLVSLGLDIELHDIEKGSGVDFIARRDGAELEVECKMFTGDLGRKIHKRKVLALHNHLSGLITRLFRSAQTGLLIRATIPDRLICSANQLRGISSAVERGLVSGRAITQMPECEVEILDFPINSSPFDVKRPDEISQESITDFVRARLGRSNRDLMTMFSPGKRAVIVLIESEKPDEMLKGIYRQLRDASKGQFTKARPGHLAVQFHDLTAEQMEDLARDASSKFDKPMGLQVMTSALLQSPNRSHIHSVAYRSHGTMLRLRRQEETLTEQGTGYFVRNPNNPYYEDQRLRPLR
jgi:hypothetical protein